MFDKKNLGVLAQSETKLKDASQFADDTALVADSSVKQKIVSEFGRMWEGQKLRINMSKRKVNT